MTPDSACWYCVGNIDGVLPPEDFVCERHRGLMLDGVLEFADALAEKLEERAADMPAQAQALKACAVAVREAVGSLAPRRGVSMEPR